MGIRSSMDPEYIASCGILAMLLELSADPKPGNVDRSHELDTKYFHFLASIAGCYKVLENAAGARERLGKLIRNAVESMMSWQSGGNTHLGIFMLLIPLCMGAGKAQSFDQIAPHTIRILHSADHEDTIQIYRAIAMAKPRLRSVSSLDVNDPGSLELIQAQRIPPLWIMARAEHDLIAREWVEGFPRSFRIQEIIWNEFNSHRNLNRAILAGFLSQLRSELDTLVETKHGTQLAMQLRSRAAELDPAQLEPIQELDRELISKGINPGTTADLCCAGIFLALVRGLRF